MAGQSVQIYDDNLNILWDSVTLKRASTNIIVTVQTRIANALLFFLDGQYLGEFDNHDHTAGNIQAIAALDISQFKSNQQYLFQILPISLRLNNGVGAGNFERKSIVGNVWLDGQLLLDNQTDKNFWEHQKGLIGEYLEIYTEEGTSKKLIGILIGQKVLRNQ